MEAAAQGMTGKCKRMNPSGAQLLLLGLGSRTHGTVDSRGDHRGKTSSEGPSSFLVSGSILPPSLSFFHSIVTGLLLWARHGGFRSALAKAPVFMELTSYSYLLSPFLASLNSAQHPQIPPSPEETPILESPTVPFLLSVFPTRMDVQRAGASSVL